MSIISAMSWNCCSLTITGGIENEYPRSQALFIKDFLAVKQCIIDAGKDGGYILSTSEYVCKNTPMINMETFVGAGLKYGKYPIRM